MQWLLYTFHSHVVHCTGYFVQFIGYFYRERNKNGEHLLISKCMYKFFNYSRGISAKILLIFPIVFYNRRVGFRFVPPSPGLISEYATILEWKWRPRKLIKWCTRGKLALNKVNTMVPLY